MKKLYALSLLLISSLISTSPRLDSEYFVQWAVSNDEKERKNAREQLTEYMQKTYPKVPEELWRPIVNRSGEDKTEQLTTCIQEQYPDELSEESQTFLKEQIKTMDAKPIDRKKLSVDYIRRWDDDKQTFN